MPAIGLAMTPKPAMLLVVPTLRDWLSSAPFTLAMSSGFFGFFAHTGVMTVLEDEGLVPSRVCGSSAGALVTGLWASGVPARGIRDELLRLRREHFWDVRPGLGLLRGARFRALLESAIAVRTFDRCRVPLAVSVFDLGARRTTVLREGELAPALHASCAAPIMFQPVRIGRRLYLDGGILDRPGLAGVDGAERVLFHHLTSPPPWRRRNDAGPRAPERPLMQVVAVSGVPSLNPFQLQRGGEAIERAAQGMRQALSRPAPDPT
ncbi:MAG TPA: patatin-like phospholipase family protein [Polyangia bacterium]|nr:patatin-like phospholipase family protein [Polyangia bacterium]